MKLSISLVSTVALIFVFSLSSLVLALPVSAVSSNPRIVQFTSGYASGGSDTSVTLTFQKPVTKGDIIVVCTGIVSGNGVAITTGSIINSRNLNFVTLASVGTSGGDTSFAKIWYASVSSSGPENFVLSYDSGPAALFGYEITGSGVTTTEFTHSFGSDNGVTSTGSNVLRYSPDAGSLVIACGGFFTLEGVGSVNAGPGYKLDQTFTANNAAEHASGFSGTSTRSPFAFGQTETVWSEVSASIAA
jgi:hypothetical protein